MAISTETRRAGPFLGTGTRRDFPFAFKVFSADQVKVVVAGEDTAESALDPSEYAVTLEADQDSAPGGTVSLNFPLATGSTLAILSAVPMVQPMVLTNRGGFYPATLNESADRAVILVQQLSEKLDRAITTDATDTMTAVELKNKLLDVASRANDLADAAQKAAEEAKASEVAAKGAAAEAAKDAEETASNLREVRETAQNIEANLTASSELFKQAEKNAESAAASAESADSSASAAAASAEQALQASKNAGYSVRYCERLEANSTMDIAALTPSANAKVGDHVVNAAGDVFEILSTTDLTFNVGDVVTSLQGPEGPQGEGIELSDAFSSIEDLLAAYPTGYPGQTVLVGNKIYVWSETTWSWVPSDSLTVTERAPDYLPWDHVTEKPALVEFDEYDKRGATLDIQSGMTYTVIN